MNINGSICKSVSDKWELFDSERDMADIGDEYFTLERLDNKQKKSSTSKKIDILVLTLPTLDKTCKSYSVAYTRTLFCSAVQ